MVRKIAHKILFLYRSFVTFIAWKKRHKIVFSQKGFKRNKLSVEEKEEYVKFWKKLGIKVKTDTVELTKSLTGVYNKLIVPEEVYSLKIEPFFNPRREVVFLENKNIYNKWFGSGIFPIDYFHKIGGKFYTSNFEIIDNIEKHINLTKISFPLVYKPSCDSYGGVGVCFVNNHKELLSLLDKYPNFVVQEKIVQSDLINVINTGSINTVRVCLLRRPSNGEVVVLNTSIRMGKDGSLDNETAGGIVCNIKEGGAFNKYAVDKYANKFFSHPNSKFVFEGQNLPNYNELLSVSKSIAAKIVGANLSSLDMCLDNKNQWRCIEVNILGQTIRFAQYAGEPFFGKYTEEVLREIYL